MIRCPLPLLFPRRWRLRDIRRAPLTRWVLLVAAVMMMGFQCAMAAYACALPSDGMATTAAMRAPTMDATMRGACPDMAPSPTDHLLCAKHCSAEASAPTGAHPLSVPPTALVALPPAVPAFVAHTQAGIAYERRDRLRSQGPSASLAFCSLLI